ncbi:MAG TPA: hypothetical protein VD713_04070 [Sphingomonadales bacterium]|nr:hypothetical protein [Sphingomonadales bacterium]
MTASSTTLVAGQIRPNRVTDPKILAAFEAVPRAQRMSDSEK